MKNFFYNQKLTTEELKLKKAAEKKINFLTEFIQYSWIFAALTIIFIIFDKNNDQIFFRYVGISFFLIFFIFSTVARTFRSFFCDEFRNLISHDDYSKGTWGIAEPFSLVLNLVFICYFFVDTKKEYVIVISIFVAASALIYFVSKFIAKKIVKG